MLVFAACFLAACGSESTGGVYNQVFNVSGHWSGTIYGECFSGGSDPVSMTLSDGGGAVEGTITTGGHSSISSGKLIGTAVQAPENTTGDNPLTADQENSNRGTLVLSLNAPQATGGVASVDVDNAGSGYTSAPTVELLSTGHGGEGATAIAVIGGSTEDAAEPGAGGVASVTVATAGSGYTSAPTVELLSTGHGGEGATAIAVIDEAEGTVVGFVVTDPGSGYATAPQVKLSGGGGSGATATAELFDPHEDPPAATVTAVIVTDPGSGYVTAPAVMFSGGGGSGATAHANIDTEAVPDLLTITLAGTSSKLSGHYSGTWACCGLAVCGSNSQGEICLSRAGLCPPP